MRRRASCQQEFSHTAATTRASRETQQSHENQHVRPDEHFERTADKRRYIGLHGAKALAKELCSITCREETSGQALVYVLFRASKMITQCKPEPLCVVRPNAPLDAAPQHHRYLCT